MALLAAKTFGGAVILLVVTVTGGGIAIPFPRTLDALADRILP